jgi:hypothetical protein
LIEIKTWPRTVQSAAGAFRSPRMVCFGGALIGSQRHLPIDIEDQLGEIVMLTASAGAVRRNAHGPSEPGHD